MKSLFQNACVIIIFVLFLLTGCMKHATVSQPGLQTELAPQAETKKIIVARVNNVELSMDSLIRMMNRLPTRDNSGAPESLEEHKKRSLDKLVLQELAYQQAKAQGLSIGVDKIDMAIKNLKENVGGEKEYADYLTKMHVTEADLRAEVERSLTLETIYSREVLAKVTIPEDEVRQEYEKEKDRYLLPEKASIIDVAILRRDGNASTKKAKELLDKLKADTDKDPWKLVLDGTFTVRGVNVNKDKEKELLEAAKKLKPNELSGVIETPTGSHIIKLKNYSPERQLAFDEVRSRLELKLKVPAQEKRTREWEQELKKGAKIEIME
jgi:parvulin-like peptidyl-prolyl isomerase